MRVSLPMSTETVGERGERDEARGGSFRRARAGPPPFSPSLPPSPSRPSSSPAIRPLHPAAVVIVVAVVRCRTARRCNVHFYGRPNQARRAGYASSAYRVARNRSFPLFRFGGF